MYSIIIITTNTVAETTNTVEQTININFIISMLFIFNCFNKYMYNNLIYQTFPLFN
jgi:hypothetical protein